VLTLDATRAPEAVAEEIVAAWETGSREE